VAIRFGLVLAALAFAVTACGGSDGIPGDGDNDGFLPEDGDCDDGDRSVYPGAPDPCDGVDNDCDGTIDQQFDADEDGFSSCGGDCRDNDPNSNPERTESIDGLDNDCDGIADNHTEQYDDDGDGYSEDQGDCDDNESGTGALIGPDAIEINETEEGEPEEIDNDCDGAVDEGELPCPTDVDPETPMAYAVALDVCNEVESAQWAEDMEIDERSRGLFEEYGDTYGPQVGSNFVVLSSGIAGDFSDPDTAFDNEVSHPAPEGAIGCSEADPSTVEDYTELELVLNVPANARSFSFDFNFMSKEFPEYVCDNFDDTFLALLQSQEFTGNVSFDSMGNRVSINVGFFDKCNQQSAYASETAACVGDDEIVGTGFEGTVGGGTGWLTTTAPVRPGEKIRLTFVIFDEGDDILDSTVLLDNFRWHVEQVEGPITVD
jgi:hypothetical protein